MGIVKIAKKAVVVFKTYVFICICMYTDTKNTCSLENGLFTKIANLQLVDAVKATC